MPSIKNMRPVWELPTTDFMPVVSHTTNLTKEAPGIQVGSVHMDYGTTRRDPDHRAADRAADWSDPGQQVR